MAVQARAFMAFRHVGQAVGSFYLEHAKDIHGRIVPPTIHPRNRSARFESGA
jgi:hypothetical protein